MLDGALVEDRDAIGELQRFFLVVGDEQGRVAGPIVDLAQPAAQVAPHLGIEGTERFVEQQHARLDGQRAGQRHPLPLAARKLGRIALAEARELHQLQQVGDAALDLGLGRPRGARPDLEAVGDVLRHVEMAEQRVVLEHEADAAVAHRQRRGVLVVEQDAAGRRRLQPGDQPQEGRLARARGAEQGHEFAGLHLKVEVAQRRGAVERLGKPLGPYRDGHVRSLGLVSAGARGRAGRRIVFRGRTLRPG